MMNPIPGSEKLLLIDGLNLVRRVYEAVPGDDSPDKAEGAAKSCLGSLRRALLEHAPSHALAAFDHGGETWRHRLYPQYKAGRKPMADELRAVLPDIIQAFENESVKSVRIPDVEAEDVLAAAALHWKPERGPVVILSTDKDLGQLHGQHIRVRDHFTSEWRDDEWSMRKFGVPTRLIGDCLALMGDATDGIPGVQKIGKGTASKLLNEYGSLAGVLQAATTEPGIKGAVGRALVAEADMAVLSRTLVSLKTDGFSLGVTWRQLELPVEVRAALAAAAQPKANPARAPRQADSVPRPAFR